ncbi:hypothetical protein [Streptomyces sp. NPDC007074]|uniref:hypothetical protein n=1 Tax=Streptomyces sp. NPDC007074 TaxID=3156764 RepID=UPI0033E506E5
MNDQTATEATKKLSLADEMMEIVTDARAQEAELRSLRNEMAAARWFADEMRDFCSPHGVAADYADRLVEAMDRARDSQANVAANNICTEIYRRMERLTDLQVDPGARQSVVENVRGEALGLQGALGIVLGGRVPGGSADRLAQAYWAEWLKSKGQS